MLRTDGAGVCGETGLEVYTPLALGAQYLPPVLHT